jgi:hypothetical protein
MALTIFSFAELQRSTVAIGTVAELTVLSDAE